MEKVDFSDLSRRRGQRHLTILTTRTYDQVIEQVTASGFQPLDPNKNQIRLVTLDSPLTLLPSDPLLCRLENVTLENAPPFIALSYVWGSMKDPATIRLNGRLVPVSSNLEAALRQIQNRRLGISKFWIDALCIDQNDDVEKSSQVRHMTEIYQVAEYVIAWLGEETSESRHAFMHIDAVYKPTKSGCALSPVAYQGKDYSPTFFTQRPECYQKFGPDLGFSDIQSRPYWRRVWILQEFTVARDVHVMCGSAVVPVDHLHYVYQIHNIGNRITDTFSTTYTTYLENPMVRVFNTRYWWSQFAGGQIGGSIMKLEGLLMKNSLTETSMASSDPRDRIYALLGISGDATELDIGPDYYAPWPEVFQDVAAKLLKMCSLRILSCCVLQNPLSDAVSFRLPSWIPNWASEAPVPLAIPNAICFSASRDLKSAPQIMEVENYSILSLQAVWVDRIQETSLPWQKAESNSPSHYGYWLAQIDELSKRGLSFYTRESRLQAVCRTPIADTMLQKAASITSDLSRASPDVALEYQILAAQSFQEHDPGFEASRRYREAMDLRAHCRRVFRTCRGFLGLAHSACMPGDQVFVLLGAEVPFVLRSVENQLWKIVSEAYVHGVMDGELMEGSPKHVTVSVC